MEIKREVGEKNNPNRKVERDSARNFPIGLAIVSVIGFLSIVTESFFYLDVSEYIDTAWLLVLGIVLVLETTIKELKSIKNKGLSSVYLGKITMVILGIIAVVAGILSLPQINLQHASFLAVKGILSILAIVLIILQTWVVRNR